MKIYRITAFTIALLSAWTLSTTTAADNISVPDFAFPQKVSEQSEKALEKALKQGDDIEALRALIDYMLAENNISSQRMPKVLSLMSDVEPQLKEESSRAILLLLKATVYNELYSDDKWNYNNRSLPLAPLPDDYTEWSGEQFRTVISQLCDSAMAYSEALKKHPIGRYSRIIKANSETAVYFPTLFDFVASHVIDLRENLSEFSNVFSIYLLSSHSIFTITPVYCPSSPEAKKILDTFAELLRFHASDTAPLIYHDIRRLQFVANGIYDTMSEQAEIRLQQQLIELYKQYSSSQFSGEVLLALDKSDGNISWKKQYYNYLDEFAQRFPSFSRLACIKNKMAMLTIPTVNINCQSLTLPNNEFNVSVNVENITNLTLKLYKISDVTLPTSEYLSQKEISKAQLVTTKQLSFPDSFPTRINQQTTFPITEFGTYVIVPEAKGISERSSFPTILCTDISIGNIKSNIRTSIFVISAKDGTPLTGAEILTRSTDRSGKTNTALYGRTDSNGFYDFPANQKISWQAFYARYNNQSVSQAINISQDAYEPQWQTVCNTFTDLAVYRPADTVRWNSVVYQILDAKNHLCENKRIMVIFRNPNDQAIDTTYVTTDSLGRVNGDFVVPTGELTGKYNIYLYSCEENNTDFIGIKSLMVSDYKMPTFFVEITNVAKSTPSEGDVTITGKVRTYSGVAMPDVALRLNIKVEQRIWWRATNAIDFYSATAVTDPSGEFHIVVEKEVFENSPAPDGIYTASLQATSQTGESRETTKMFTLGKALQLMAMMPENVEVSAPVRINLCVTDAYNQYVDTLVDCRIVSDDDNKTVMQTSLRTTNPEIDLRSLKSGQYNFVFSLPSQDSDSLMIDDIVLFRKSDKMPPVEFTLWTPYNYSETLTTSRNNSIEILYGNSRSTHVLYILSEADSIYEWRWIKAEPGMHNLRINLPDGLNKAQVNLAAVSDHSPQNHKIRIVTPEKEPSIRIMAESFRDRIIPGTQETWTFRTVDQDSTGIASAMILNMYNKALDEIYTSSWRFTPQKDYIPQLSVSLPYSFKYSLSRSGISEWLQCAYIYAPEFQFYNQSLSHSHIRYKLYGSRNALSLSSAAGAAAGLAVGTAEMAADNSELNDVVVTGYASNLAEHRTATISTTTEPITEKTTPFEYRDNECTLAIYQPSLNTDSEGRLTFSYRVPNANTTWRLNAIAYTRDLLTDLFSADIIANKPVMVQPNMPRFVRTGDEIVIAASVMNNSESEKQIATMTELFNPATGAIIARNDTTMTIAANESAAVSIRLSAPAIPFVGYRIKSTADMFTDGEQSLIPVLPNATPVIETQPFYISPDSTTFAMQIAHQGSDARVTLQFCDNPAWYVVTALPGLRSNKITTPQEAADAIFSAAVAEGLLRDYPAVKEALHHWTTSDRSDSTLTSMLERNADLKTMLLKATPWMMDAASDTERMQRLALLFDDDEIKNVYDQSIATLKKLTRPSGGWAWVVMSDEASEWATFSALYTLGRLNAAGYLPTDKGLNDMIKNALKWQENQTVETYRRHPDISFMSYVCLRDLWPGEKPSATGQSIIAREIQRIVKNWKKYDVNGKATAINLLTSHGYPTLARTVAESLMEYSESTPEKGLWWPSVDDTYGGSLTQLSIAADALSALHTINPYDPAIDKIRQWLILQKEARNWGSSATASQIIATFLSTSGSWVKPAQPVVVKVGGKKVDATATEDILGYFRTDISQMQPSEAMLTVEKTDRTPAWGAVYSQSVQTITDVKAASCDAVSIEKRIYRQNGSKWESVNGTLKVGERVKVQLLIHADRDMQYVAINDDRAACLEPVEQLPRPIYAEGICFYRENRDATTNMFVTNMPAGTYLLEYELWVNNSGTFSSGIATIQSQYAPQITAHSAGSTLIVD